MKQTDIFEWFYKMFIVFLTTIYTIAQNIILIYFIVNETDNILNWSINTTILNIICVLIIILLFKK